MHRRQEQRLEYTAFSTRRAAMSPPNAVAACAAALSLSAAQQRPGERVSAPPSRSPLHLAGRIQATCAALSSALPVPLEPVELLVQQLLHREPAATGQAQASESLPPQRPL